ncbi:MAG: hypothetical protein Ta2G_06030 [Termitinemataceae bacterium]|nr:MAG: hypothetical protein Ta2G_06030 [Termitinemataceae bacterium]
MSKDTGKTEILSQEDIEKLLSPMSQTSDNKQGVLFGTRGENNSLLYNLSRIYDLSKKKGLNASFYAAAREHINFISSQYSITPVQAVLFAQFVAMCDDYNISCRDISTSIKCDNFALIQYMNDFDALAKKKLIKSCRSHEGNNSYRVPYNVINALRNNTVIVPPLQTELDITGFFDALEVLVDQRNADEIDSENFFDGANELIENNQHLVFCRNIKLYHLDNTCLVLLLYFCEAFVNNDVDEITMHHIRDAFDSPPRFRNIRRALRDQNLPLFDKNLIENSSSASFANREAWRLSDKAKKELLCELDVNQRVARLKKDLILHEKIAEKQMFYNDKEAEKIEQLCAVLQQENFNAVLERLETSGMRTGFACLFYGPPGTGKTETVNAIARRCGRDIMMVNIAETKSCWFGESEKKIKEVFDRYRSYVETNDVAPILLFNEADAVIGKRKDVSSGNVAQTENAIQNIILQEMETLKGIMIATTNLTANLDNAFERRFLYKIEFEKPTLQARKSIWQSLVADLSDDDASTLSQRYNFSGGQIENIARKRTVETVISGSLISIDTLCKYCDDELLNKDERKIGFAV